MVSGSSRKLGLLLLLAAQACSPLYETRSAFGHIRFLARRRSIEKTIKDPRTPPELKARLQLVQEIRQFGFERMGLRRSAEYSTYSPVQGRYLTWLVSGSKKTSFTPYEWHFWPAGRFPYQGHFKKEQAVAEKERLEKKGYDACVRGVSAYNTPLWISDPLPSTVLDYATGDLAEVLLHELTHSTVYYKDHSDFDEAVANFAGEKGAEDFLTYRFGQDSKELSDYREGLKRDRAVNDEIDSLYDRLDAIYRNSATDEEKLSERQPILEEGREKLSALGFEVPKLNNAVILASRLYHEDQSVFERAFEKCGRDWPKTFALLKSLDRRDPLGDLRRSLSAS